MGQMSDSNEYVGQDRFGDPVRQPSTDPEAIRALGGDPLIVLGGRTTYQSVPVDPEMIRSMSMSEYASLRGALLSAADSVGGEHECSAPLGCPYADIGVFVCAHESECMHPCSADLFELPQ
jgi:hypothetical protein